MSCDRTPGSKLPTEVLHDLRRVTGNLTIVLLKRRIGAEDMAARMGVTLKALRKLEAGDPSASLGTFAAAKWVLDSWPGLGFVASVKPDESGVP